MDTLAETDVDARSESLIEADVEALIDSLAIDEPELLLDLEAEFDCDSCCDSLLETD